MALTLGMTGMDSSTEAALKAAVDEAAARMTQRWTLLPEGDADHVVVDMDSMYGPMSWLRLHAAGKRVIGLTSAPRTQADFRLERPFDAASVAALLEQIGADEGAPQTAPPPASAADAQGMAAATAGEPADGVAAAAESSVDAAPAPVPAERAPLSEEPATVVRDTASDAESATEPPPPAPVPQPPRERRLADWLEPGALTGRVRYRPTGQDALLIDADKRVYHGPAALKPLAGHFQPVLAEDDFESLDDAAWASATAELGTAHPLVRLQWYGGLLAGHGELLPGYDPQGRYKLGKWPQTEREFPKHFRLATTMMKGPATLDEIAATSGVERADVVDFVNASLVSGFAELVPETPPEPPEATKPAGLFGRLRGK